MSAPSQTAADLRAAAEVLRRDGWTREAYVSDEGSCCAVGALMKVTTPDASPATDVLDLTPPARQRVRDAIAALVPVAVPGRPTNSGFWEAPITRWNDEHGRTADEVIAALEAAADAAEAQS